MEALRLVRDNLPRAFADGGDIPARANMMTAAMMGALAFQKGLGAVHSLSHPLGFLFKIHHGLLNAILLPFVVAHNCEADKSGATARKLARLARFLRLTPADPEGVLRGCSICGGFANPPFARGGFGLERRSRDARENRANGRERSHRRDQSGCARSARMRADSRFRAGGKNLTAPIFFRRRR